MKNNITLLIAVILLLVSCSKELDVTPPNNITDEQIMELLKSKDEQKVILILGSIANGIPTMFRASAILGQGVADGRYYTCQGLDAMRNLESNDIVFGTKTMTTFGADEYNLKDFTSSAVDKNTPYWYYAWQCVTTANKLINFLKDDAVVSTMKSLQDYKARALILRAYAYNYLMENYQDAYLQGGKDKLGIMLYDTYSPTQQMKARSTSQETYAFIKKDLNDAIALLNSAGIGYTATLTDLDLGVAYFLLARVSLWTGDWNTVITTCDDIMKHYPKLMTQGMYGGTNTGTDKNPIILPETNGFLNNTINTEVLLGWPIGEALTAHNAWMNAFGGGSGGLGEGFQRIDNRLYDKISENDFRKTCFLKNDFGDYAYPPNNVKAYIPAYTNIKFAATHGIGSPVTDRTKVGTVTDYYMRASEALLMKAEAQAQSGKEADAKATLNILLAARTKQGSPALTCDNYPSMSGLSALQMVQLQTRIELWGEGGREFYNNKRWNIPVDRTSSSNHITKLTYSVANMTLKIPDDEMFYNSLCKQN